MLERRVVVSIFGHSLSDRRFIRPTVKGWPYLDLSPSHFGVLWEGGCKMPVKIGSGTGQGLAFAYPLGYVQVACGTGEPNKYSMLFPFGFPLQTPNKWSLKTTNIQSWGWGSVRMRQPCWLAVMSCRTPCISGFPPVSSCVQSSFCLMGLAQC